MTIKMMILSLFLTSLPLCAEEKQLNEEKKASDKEIKREIASIKIPTEIERKRIAEMKKRINKIALNQFN
jgi:hypothetical protein